MLKKLFLVFILLCAIPIYPFTNNSFLTYRSQNVNAARSIVGWQELRNDLFEQCANGNISLALEYTRSFDACALNNYFFGKQCLTFSGSRVADRGAGDILADYFGLPTDFNSVVCFNPRVKNAIADLDWYWNLPTCNAFYLRLNTALVHTSWNLNGCERVIDPGVLNYPAGYMSSMLVQRSTLPTSALQAMSGAIIFGDVTVPLQYGRISDKQTKTALADIYVAVGYTPIACDDYHLGFDVHTVIPTGTRSCAVVLFEPQIGNGHHWAVGASITGHYALWESACNDFALNIYCDAYIQHLFRSEQIRSYDFKENGPGSRYMLIEGMVPSYIIRQLGFGDTAPLTPFEYEYTTLLSPAINKTTFASSIKIDAQAEVVIKLAGSWCNWTADIGYNLWARSREKLVCRERLLDNHFAIKGDAQVYGFIEPSPGIGIFLSVPLNATQSHATLHAGQGAGNANLIFTNENADNPDIAKIIQPGTSLFQSTPAGVVGSGITAADLEPVNASNQAILITDAHINNCSGLSPRAFSNKIFGHVGYTWDTTCDASPYLGIGAEGEFSGRVCGFKTAVSQWGIWIKGGVTY